MPWIGQRTECTVPVMICSIAAYFPRLIALAVIGVVVFSGTVSANGKVTQFERQAAGPYEIALGTIPGKAVTGPLHLTVTVSELASQDPIFDADVVITGRGPESQAPEVGPLTAQSSPTDPVFYDASAEVGRVGSWVFTVAVRGELGEAAADFEVDVGSPSTFGQVLTWIAVVVFFVLVTLGLAPLLRHRFRRRARKA